MSALLLTLLLLAQADGAASTAPPAAGPGQAPLPGAPVIRHKPNSFEGFGRTPEEERMLEDLTQAMHQYEQESRDFRREIQLLIEKKYEEKRSTLAGSYERAIRDLETLERKERLDAIAKFEEFLRRYPDDPRYSPDVMFRLAELYYERSSDDHLLAMREYEERLKGMDPAKNEEPPPEPQADFAKSIAIYRQLIRQFPEYKLNDAAYYLLGYCLEKQNQFDEGQNALRELIARYPKSRFATEAWVRIGEYYFDAYNDPEALTRAAAAYESAIKDTTHTLYDKALYKLGWTYYRMDRFEDAVGRFLALVDFYQSKAKGDEAPGGDLRNEALQYTAISLSDEKWGSLARAQEIFQRLGGRKYEAEVYRRLGDVYFDQTKHADAIEAFRLVLQKDPLAGDAPQVQQKIVQAYERDRRLDESFREAEKLALNYGPGSSWHEKHRREADLLATAQALAEKNLYAAAIYHHQQALQLKKDGKFQEAKAAFDVAAQAYGSYFLRFPRSKNSYDVQFYYAECLYNSLQFGPAASNYEAVRDSPADQKFMADAAFAAFLSREKQVLADVESKKIPELKPLRSAERPEGQKVEVLPMADSEKKLVKAADAFVTRLPGDERAPGLAYKAAELFYSHNDFPEARKRFEEIVKAYPKNEVAQFSTNLIVESFLVDKDWKAVEEVSERLAANKDVIDPKSNLFKDLTKFKLAGRFKLADEMFQLGRYEEAAKKYIELVNEEPKHEFADKALNNAAVCYENTRRFDSALKLYERIFREYPASKLADSALFRVAVNAENSYDFDKAVESYQRLVKDYPASKDREAALYNAARLLEGQQRYGEAANAFQRYAELFPQAEDAPKNLYRAALIYEKQSDWRREIRELEEFVRKYSGKPAQAELSIDARKRIGDAYLKLGEEKEAARAFKAAADEFDRKGMKPEQEQLAADAAAYSRFMLAEEELKQFDKVKIGGRGKALEKSFTAKKAAVKKVNDSYNEVLKYKRIEWTLAAFYRKGYALERFGQTIIETPVPPEVKRLGEDAVVLYQDQLAQQTAALEDKAVEAYAATLAEARKNRISNEWTKKTLESLNRFRPKEYPVLKEPKDQLAVDMEYPEGLVSTLEGNAVQAGPSRAGIGGEEK